MPNQRTKFECGCKIAIWHPQDDEQTDVQMEMFDIIKWFQKKTSKQCTNEQTFDIMRFHLTKSNQCMDLIMVKLTISSNVTLNPSPPVLIYIRQSLNVQSFHPSGST